MDFAIVTCWKVISIHSFKMRVTPSTLPSLVFDTAATLNPLVATVRLPTLYISLYRQSLLVFDTATIQHLN